MTETKYYTTKEFNSLACVIMNDHFENFQAMLIEQPAEPMVSASQAVGIIAGSLQMMFEKPKDVLKLLDEIKLRNEQQDA